ncbi:MAG: hypothetical protein VX642_15000 [Bdellovibrionota bacterium]|nr:hypothetical protein [Bdellovibrionota bacterium]
MKYILVLILAFPSFGFAYIPKTITVLKNIAETRTDSPLRIKKEIIFQTESDKYLVKETWYIKDSENFYVIASGPGFKFEALHQNGQRYRRNKEGQLLKSQDDVNFYMPLFVSNDANVIGNYLVRSNILLPSVLQKPKAFHKMEEIKYSPEERIRLTRKDGVVHFGLGEPSPVQASTPKAQAWILQNDFYVSKLRQSDFTIEARDFKKYARSISYPEKMLLKWDLFNIEMQTLDIDRISVGKNTKEKFEVENLSNQSDSQALTENPTIDSVRKFYLKFR